ncbi:MAG: hypothetical protein KC505_11355 [Myxococcales bacterium]|nr:hypothetical protein [Myxococcales bacterium]USN51491.1 MAG: hypothetical protein H6731_03540 [Myxococcales bacterium]
MSDGGDGTVLASITTDDPVSNPTGEEAGYTLNKSSGRSSWVIKEGRANAIVKEYMPDAPGGPGYVVEITYDMKVRFKGHQQGSIALLVPEQVFADNFIEDLMGNHPMAFGGFELDYHGTDDAKDADDNLYEDCAKTRIFNIDTDYQPPESSNPSVYVLYSKGAKIENLEVKMKVHDSLPVIGAVQLDVSGKVLGFNFKAGFDYKPNN